MSDRPFSEVQRGLLVILSVLITDMLHIAHYQVLQYPGVLVPPESNLRPFVFDSIP